MQQFNLSSSTEQIKFNRFVESTTLQDNYVFYALSITSSRHEELFFIFYNNVQRNVTYTADLHYYITTEFEYARCDCRLAHGGLKKAYTGKNGKREYT